MNKLLISIDQGGSKTDIAIISCNGELLYRGNDKEFRSPNNCNFESKRWYYISKLVQASLVAIGASLGEVDCLLAALCGVDWIEDYSKAKVILSNKLRIEQKKIIVVNDCTAALRACLPLDFQRQNSAIIYAGTMFNCSVVTESGQSYTYGRFVNGNDQGAYAIGLSVWKSILDSYNGFQEHTVMENMMLKSQKINSIPELIEEITTNKRLFLPITYAPIFFHALEVGDKVAINIFNYFVQRWVRYVTEGIHRVGLSLESSICVYLSGGVFKNCTRLWINAITEELKKSNLQFTCSLSAYEPIAGAVIMLLERMYMRPLNFQTINEITSSPIFQSMMIRIPEE